MEKQSSINIAIITAGGIGTRMGKEIPKQFIEIKDKPVIVHTIQCFQNNENIDKIILVGLEGWIPILRDYIIDYELTKVSSIIKGGDTNFESIKKGVIEAYQRFGETNIIVMHDGIRPNLSDEVIDDSLRVCKEFGNSTSVINCAEVMMLTEDKVCSTSHIHRDKLMRTQTPQSYYIKDLVDLYKEADERGITNSTSLCSLMVELDKKVYFSKGSEKNIKLTIPEDISIFEALLEIERGKEYAKKLTK